MGRNRLVTNVGEIGVRYVQTGCERTSHVVANIKMGSDLDKLEFLFCAHSQGSSNLIVKGVKLIGTSFMNTTSSGFLT